MPAPIPALSQSRARVQKGQAHVRQLCHCQHQYQAQGHSLGQFGRNVLRKIQPNRHRNRRAPAIGLRPRLCPHLSNRPATSWRWLQGSSHQQIGISASGDRISAADAITIAESANPVKPRTNPAQKQITASSANSAWVRVSSSCMSYDLSAA
jgi:hypothetical protein